jgi:hypothetical protein
MYWLASVRGTIDDLRCRSERYTGQKSCFSQYRGLQNRFCTCQLLSEISFGTTPCSTMVILMPTLWERMRLPTIKLLPMEQLHKMKTLSKAQQQALKQRP